MSFAFVISQAYLVAAVPGCALRCGHCGVKDDYLFQVRAPCLRSSVRDLASAKRPRSMFVICSVTACINQCPSLESAFGFCSSRCVCLTAQAGMLCLQSVSAAPCISKHQAEGHEQWRNCCGAIIAACFIARLLATGPSWLQCCFVFAAGLSSLFNRIAFHLLVQDICGSRAVAALAVPSVMVSCGAALSRSIGFYISERFRREPAMCP